MNIIAKSGKPVIIGELVGGTVVLFRGTAWLKKFSSKFEETQTLIRLSDGFPAHVKPNTTVFLATEIKVN